MENLMYLTQIYNTLCLVHTKGEDSIIMADCLKALQQYLKSEQKKDQKTEDEIQEE